MEVDSKIESAGLAGKCPASPALQDGAKGHNMKEKYLTGKPRAQRGELQSYESLSLNT